MTLTSWFTHNSLRRPRFVLVTHRTVQSPSRHKLSKLKIFSRVVNTVQWLATMTHDSSTGRLENNHTEYTTTEPFKRPAKWRHQQLCIRPVSLNYHIRPSFAFKIPPTGFEIPLNYSCWPTWPRLILLRVFRSYCPCLNYFSDLTQINHIITLSQTLSTIPTHTHTHFPNLV